MVLTFARRIRKDGSHDEDGAEEEEEAKEEASQSTPFVVSSFVLRD